MTPVITRYGVRRPKQLARSFGVSGFYVWSHALESSTPGGECGRTFTEPAGLRRSLARPAPHSITLLGADWRRPENEENFAPLGAKPFDSNAAISGMWDINYFHRRANRIS